MSRKRTPIEREGDLAIVSDMYISGYSHHEIARRIAIEHKSDKISIKNVESDLAVLKARWKEASNKTTEEWIREELQSLAKVEKEAWQAYERSKGDSVTKTISQRGLDDDVNSPTTSKTISSSNRDGDARFMQIIIQCRHRRAELLGLDAPKKIEGIIANVSLLPGIPNDNVDKLLAEHFGGQVIEINGNNGHTNGGTSEVDQGDTTGEG